MSRFPEASMISSSLISSHWASVRCLSGIACSACRRCRGEVGRCSSMVTHLQCWASPAATNAWDSIFAAGNGGGRHMPIAPLSVPRLHVTVHVWLHTPPKAFLRRGARPGSGGATARFSSILQESSELSSGHNPESSITITRTQSGFASVSHQTGQTCGEALPHSARGFSFVRGSWPLAPLISLKPPQHASGLKCGRRHLKPLARRPDAVARFNATGPDTAGRDHPTVPARLRP